MSAERPSPVAWVVVVAGWVVMAVAVVGAWRDEGLSGDVPDWGAWLVGSALVHDGVLLPVVVVAGWLLSRGLPSAWRVPLRAGLVGLGLVALAVWPIAMRWGARDDNPSILPLPVARNLGLLAVAVAIGCLAWGTVRYRRHITDNDEGGSTGGERRMIHMERASDGSRRHLAVHDWQRPATPGERRLLDDLCPAVLDVGCGPGRLAAALAERGRPALGIDVSPSALRSAMGAGAVVLERSVFDRLPGEGRWNSVLLMDGNVGIGGDPARLLARIGELLGPDGRAIVEVGAPGTPTEVDAVRLHPGCDEPGPWFDWAWVGADAVAELARSAGFGSCAVVEVECRHVALLAERSCVRRREPVMS